MMHADPLAAFEDRVARNEIRDEDGNALRIRKLRNPHDSFFACLAYALHGEHQRRVELRRRCLLRFVDLLFYCEKHKMRDLDDYLCWSRDLRVRTKTASTHQAIQKWVLHIHEKHPDKVPVVAREFIAQKEHRATFRHEALSFLRMNRNEGDITCRWTFCQLVADLFPTVQIVLFHFDGDGIKREPPAATNAHDGPRFTVYLLKGQDGYSLLEPRPAPTTTTGTEQGGRRRLNGNLALMKSGSWDGRPSNATYQLRRYDQASGEGVKVATFRPPPADARGYVVHVCDFPRSSNTTAEKDAEDDGEDAGIVYQVCTVYRSETKQRKKQQRGMRVLVYAINREPNGTASATLLVNMEHEEIHPHFLLDEERVMQIALLVCTDARAGATAIRKELKVAVKE